MPPPRPLRLAPEWDGRYTRMLGVSAAAHVGVIAAVLVLAPYAALRPPPLVAYTVEITDPSALGGRVPPGAAGRDLSGGSAPAPAPIPKGVPEAKPPATEPPAKPEPVAAPEPPAKPEPPPEPKPVAKPEPPPTIPEAPQPLQEPKAEVKPPEPKPEPKPAAKPAEPAQPPASKAEPKPADAARSSAAATKTGAAKSTASTARPGSPAGQENAPQRDAYAAAAERWRSRGSGGGLGGAESGSGPIGTRGEGKAGGGQLAGLEYIAYQQQVINTIKGNWTNVIARPGLVAKIRFAIAPDGTVSDVRIEESSGNAAYDGSAVRAVRNATLPPPPARYVKDFSEFLMEFHSEEKGGQGTG